MSTRRRKRQYVIGVDHLCYLISCKNRAHRVGHHERAAKFDAYITKMLQEYRMREMGR